MHRWSLGERWYDLAEQAIDDLERDAEQWEDVSQTCSGTIDHMIGTSAALCEPGVRCRIDL